MIFLLRGAGDGVPKECAQQAAADQAKVPNLRACEHPLESGVAPQGEKIEITCCRGAVQSAWHSTSSEPHQRGGTIRQRGGKIGLPGNRKVDATSYGDDSPLLSLPSTPTAAVFTAAAMGVRQGTRQGW